MSHRPRVAHTRHRPTDTLLSSHSSGVTPVLRLLLLLAVVAAPFATTTVSAMKVVVVGGGIQGTSVAYHLAKLAGRQSHDVTILEAVGPASAASGKGGGFMARSWGDGTKTKRLHELAFDMYESLAKELSCESYRKIPVLSVTPGRGKGVGRARPDPTWRHLVPGWLDVGNVDRIAPMGEGDDTAQITPAEFVTKMLEAQPSIQLVAGTCTGFATTTHVVSGRRMLKGVYYDPANHNRTATAGAVAADTTAGEDRPSSPSSPSSLLLEADAVVVCAGPWSCQAEDWMQKACGVTLRLPMEGIKSASIVWEAQEDVDATALFCGEDDRFGTHLEVYPRPDGTIYICGIGGSDYISTDELKRSAFLGDCPPNMDRVEAATRSFRDMATSYQAIELVKQQACMRPCPPDALPYMGELDGCDGAYINAGHNCWGIAWAPACGKAMAELVDTGECSCLDLLPFSPSRFTPSAKGRGRKKKGVDVGEQW